MLVVEVRQGTLGRWMLAVEVLAGNTGRGCSWLRSGGGRWAWKVEVGQGTLGVDGRDEVRQGTLGSGG